MRAARHCLGVAVAWLLSHAWAACTAAPQPAATSVATWPVGLRPFLGEFRGSLFMHGAAAVREVPMALLVEPLPDEPDQLRWQMRYGEGAALDVRDYRLGVDDAALGACHIDERNGIVLPARLCGDELVSVFLVGGQTLVTRYRAEGDRVQFALEAFDAASARAAGPQVQAVPRVAVHRASLARVR